MAFCHPTTGHVYYLQVWTTERTIFNEGVERRRSQTVTGIPTDGSEVRVRILTHFSGEWRGDIERYRAAD